LTASTSVGGLAPDFEAVSLDGKTVQLRELRGKIVLLNFLFLTLDQNFDTIYMI
jgi:peroxiredoxin